MANRKRAAKMFGGGAWSRRALLVLTLVAAIPWLPNPARARESRDGLSTEPVLRIETGLHGAQIRRIDTDAENRFAVTASEDKTVRLWSLPDGKLLRIFRLPLGPGDMGKAFAVAISPDDGSTIAAGGYNHNIFLFDRTSGVLKKRLSDMPDAVSHLAYSPDGRRLVASLGGSSGIRVFDVRKGYKLLPSDMQYKDNSLWASFDNAGRLVTASDDGFVRLYASGQYAHPIRQFRLEGHQPLAAAFSPDGNRVAVGYHETPKVVVLAGSDLTKLFEANTSGIPDGDLSSVGWSQDGHFLFAGGTWQVHSVVQIRRWSNGGSGAYTDIPTIPAATMMEILGLKSGSMLFAHAYGFGVIGLEAKVQHLQGFASTPASPEDS